MPATLWSDRHLEVLVGDASAVLAGLPEHSVHAVVTSPPYWGLRDYSLGDWTGGDPEHSHRGSVARTAPPGTPKQASNAGSLDVRSGDCECGARLTTWQGGDADCPHRPGPDRHRYRGECPMCGATQAIPLGLEADPEEFVERMVGVFREVRRVLRKDGTLWLNLGDTYGGSSGSSFAKGLNAAERGSELAGAERRRPGLRSKDLAGIPWRVALALQADGWYLRADIIWSKPNPMPSSTTDRPTVAHEYVFLLAPSPRYFYDADAVRELTGREASWEDYAEGDGHHQPYDRGLDLLEGVSAGWGRKRDTLTHPLGRNLRSVWTIATQPYVGAHYATFPEALVEPCVLAGTSAYGVCQTCGAPWRRVVEVGYRSHGAGQSFATGWTGGSRRAMPGEKTLTDEAREAGQAPGPQGMPHGRADKLVDTVGWKPGCEHGGMVVPATVLDPFAGSGTTGVVAQRLGRRAVLIDAKGDYLAGQAMRRNEQIPLGLLGTLDTENYGSTEADPAMTP